MGKYLNILLFTLSIGIIVSCKKNTSSNPVTPNDAKCVVKTATSLLSGNNTYTEYEFDNTGKPTFIKGYRPNGSIGSEAELGFTSVVHYRFDGPAGRRPSTIVNYNADIFTELPTKANVSVWVDDTLMVDRWTYFFFYNAKNQLIKVGEQTENIAGDWEWDLNIYYNEKGNVTALQYETTTGPNLVIPPVTVTAYDDKPTPYSGFKGWRFLCNWESAEAEPILSALSKNNPLDYTSGTGPGLFKCEMVYTYNTDGFPIERKNTNKTLTNEYTFLQSYTYTCK
jgi:hypothetical protein